MNMTMRWLFVCAVVPVVSTLGCGGETLSVNQINDAAPEEIAGGGIGSGAVDGKINVYAIDGATEAPIAGAAVRIGESDAAAPLEGKTDSTGLVTFKDDALQGAQTITVTAADHVATTWFGVNGANVTIPLGPTTPPPLETAQVSGTIAGFDGLTNATNHVWLAFVGFSWTGNPGNAANDIQQPGDRGCPPIRASSFPRPPHRNPAIGSS